MTDCCNLTDTFWSDQLAEMKAEVVVYNAAIRALAAGGVQNYRLSTGQTDQMVTRLNLSSLRDTRDALLSDIDVLEARLCGTATIRMVPGFP